MAIVLTYEFNITNKVKISYLYSLIFWSQVAENSYCVLKVILNDIISVLPLVNARLFTITLVWIVEYQNVDVWTKGNVVQQSNLT